MTREVYEKFVRLLDFDLKIGHVAGIPRFDYELIDSGLSFGFYLRIRFVSCFEDELISIFGLCKSFSLSFRLMLSDGYCEIY